jgi:pyruvate dehydrogenase E2 component (dihydrolipoamide acetyltransferase)
MITFRLPDLGEGLTEAEIVRWHVKVGDTVAVDQPLLSVETAKAVVEVPAPSAGVVTALHCGEGERIEIGAPLVEFNGGDPAAAAPADAGDSGTVVGHMPSDSGEYAESANAARAASLQRIRAVPAARALARSLGVDLATVHGSGDGGLITLADVIGAGLPSGRPASPRGSTMRPAPEPHPGEAGHVQELKSLRRAMAQSMALSRDSVMECTVVDDADLRLWRGRDDYTVRVLRAIARACAEVPGLNAWYDSDSQSRRLFEHVNVGLAVDTPDGLIVPVLRNVGEVKAEVLRAELNRLKKAAGERSLRGEELRGFTFMLSNFGMMAGRYASPVVVPPAVAILGTGRTRDDVVAVEGRVEIHRRMPLSLTFDHRVVTGAEAVRWLAALIRDLELPE